MYDTNAKFSFFERLSLLGIVAQLPFRLLSSIIFSPFLARTKRKRVNRIIAEGIIRHLSSKLSVRQAHHFIGLSTVNYLKWAKKKRITPVVEDIVGGDKGKILWFTEKRTDRVLVYAHGGGFVSPHLDNMYGFLPGLREAWLKTGGKEDYAIASVAYTLYPELFPTQLRDFTLALTQIISDGVDPENIILLGDSAGGNLISQFILHTLNPVPDVPRSPISIIENVDVPSRRLGGIVLMSPFMSMSATPSYARNNKYDFVTGATFARWGGMYIKDVSQWQLPWIQPTSSSQFKGVEKITSRMLITGGSHECLLDGIEGLHAMLWELDIPKEQFDLTLDIDEGGIHEDPILDIEAPQPSGLKEATMRLANWIGKTFSDSK